MRHIPDNELHAYLDQALSRSQCVEIESHLAECPACQSARDGIAALRDRTTALLAKLAPPVTVAPPFETIRHRTTARLSARRRRIQWTAWAASVVFSIGLGWAARSLWNTAREASPAPAARPWPAAAVSPAGLVAAQPKSPDSARPAMPKRPSVRPMVRPTARDSAADAEPPVLERGNPPAPLFAQGTVRDSIRQQVLWGGQQVTDTNGVTPPHIDGLPIVQVQVHENEKGKRPLMVVAQRLESGEVIRTIEGPVADVSRLIGMRAMSDLDPSDSAGPKSDHTMAMQRGDRMLAITGALPSDSLRAMIRRLNAALRSR